MNCVDVLHINFSPDPINNLQCARIGIGYRCVLFSQIYVLCTAYASNLCNKTLYP